MQNEHLRAMVNETSISEGISGVALPPLGDARKLALLYAPSRLRAAYEALFHVDLALGRIAISPGEPILKQIKLAWWRETLSQNADGVAQHPIAALALRQSCWTVASRALLVDGWEMLAADTGDMHAACQSLMNARVHAVADMTDGPLSPELERAVGHWAELDVARVMKARGQDRLQVGGGALQPLPKLPRKLRPLSIIGGLARRALATGGVDLMAGRASPFIALRLGILGR